MKVAGLRLGGIPRLIGRRNERVREQTSSTTVDEEDAGSCNDLTTIAAK
jgi:hypothetical protein